MSFRNLGAVRGSGSPMIYVMAEKRDTEGINARRRALQKEKRLRNVELLGKECSICGATEKLEVHHRWYDGDDAGTHSNHQFMRELIESEPGRFACLCHRCNTFVGHVHASMKDNTYDMLIDEADKVVKGRKNHSADILTARHALGKQVKCTACDNVIVVRGNHQKKFCSKECILKNRRKTHKDQRQYQSPAILRCVICEKTFQITTGNQITCSPKCRMKRSEKVKEQRNLKEKEARLRNINRLGGQCRVCDTKEKLEVHHRWYIDDDRAMRSKHTFIEKMVMAQPARFTCLCHRCNTLVGRVYTSMGEGTYDKVCAEARKMLKGRKNNPQSVLIAYSRVPERQIRCAECDNLLTIHGRHGKRFCNTECKNDYYRRPDIKAKRQEYNKAYYRRSNPPKILSCVICKEEFEQKTGGQKSCSKKCSNERNGKLKKQYAREHRMQKFFACDICDNEFQRKDGSKACSIECRMQLEYRRNQTQYRRLKELRDANATHLTCKVCGGRFRKKPGPAAGACSDACKGELRRRKCREKHQPTLVACSVCKKSFQRKGPHKTCSAECHKIHVRRYHIDYNTTLKLNRH